MPMGKLRHGWGFTENGWGFTERTYTFGKIDYTGSGRRINLVEAEVEIYRDGRFAVSGGIWNSKHTDYLICGQMLNEIAHVPEDDALFQEIKRLWSKYHLKNKSKIPPKDWAKIVTLMNLPKDDPLRRRL